MPENMFTPSEDFVRVVRCRNCKHYRVWRNGNITCWYWTDTWDAATEPDDFCSHGERRDESAKNLQE